MNEPIVTEGLLSLKPEHKQHLLDSGIEERVIDARGYWSADRVHHATFLRALKLGSFVNRLPGLMIPIFGPNGEQQSAHIRLDVAPVGMRYASPARSERPVTMDVHPLNAPKLSDASVELWITEGVKKADAATSAGLCCIALMGVTMWTRKSDKGNVTALPEWDNIELRERNVYVAFDSDVTTKVPVRKALAKLKTFLENRGAFVQTVYLPNAEDGSKVGLDDYLADGKSADDLYSLPRYLVKGQYSDPKLLEEMNRQLAVLEEPAGSILFENDDGYQVCRPSDLRTLFADIQGGDERDAITWWLKQSGRRRFRKIVFRPGQEVERDYNLWKGWALEPKPGDISPFWEFVREVICDNDPARYQYIRKWMAHAVQKPAAMPRTALLFHSVEGTGKGMFMDWFKPIFGRHAFTVTSLENAIGHFNAHLSQSLLVFANEAIWGGDKKSQGRMKALITDETTDVTSKGKDTIMLDNFKRWVFASNADHPVPIDRSDRRFVVFEVSAVRKGQTAYYKSLEDLRDDSNHSGSAALMYDLLREDISSFNPDAGRPTSGLAKYKELSATPFDQWLLAALNEAEIRKAFKGHDCYEPWGGLIAKNTVYDAYKEAAKGRRGDTLPLNSFWTKMREIGVIMETPSKAKILDPAGNRTRAAELAPLAEARVAFARYMAEDEAILFAHAVDGSPSPCDDRAHHPQEQDDEKTPF
jgi:hypothetical protein